MASNALIYAMAAHIGLTALLYTLLTAARAPAVWGVGRRPDGSNPWAEVEPCISANLSNQFEWPVFFYAACLLLMVFPAGGVLPAWLAWVFVTGRVVHSYVQIAIPNLRLRGLVFTINYLAVLGMWGVIVVTRATSP